MKHFPREAFYTDDFDQEMMDFVKIKYAAYKGGYMKEYWMVQGDYLKYQSGNDYFWTSVMIDESYTYLTKQQFKEKIGMTTKQFTKSDLVAGKHVVETANGQQYLILHSIDKPLYGVNLNGNSYMCLATHNEDLSYSSNHTIVAVYEIQGARGFYELSRDLGLIWKREEKSEAQIQFEKLQQQITELQAQADKLEATL